MDFSSKPAHLALFLGILVARRANLQFVYCHPKFAPPPHPPLSPALDAHAIVRDELAVGQAWSKSALSLSNKPGGRGSRQERTYVKTEVGGGFLCVSDRRTDSEGGQQKEKEKKK